MSMDIIIDINIIINININIDINLTININININIVINLLAQQMQPEPPWDGSKMDGMSYEQDRKSVSLAVRGGGGRGDKGDDWARFVVSWPGSLCAVGFTQSSSQPTSLHIVIIQSIGSA